MYCDNNCNVINRKIKRKLPKLESSTNLKCKQTLGDLKQYIKLAALLILVLLAVGLIVYLVIANLTSSGDSSQNEQKQEIHKADFRGLKPPNVQVQQAPSGSPLLVYEKAAVSTDNQICSDIGKNMFDKGGNVMDAALAALVCNGLLTMQSMGIGGGMIMNVFIKSENRAYTIDARELSPYSSREDMFSGLPKEASFNGPLAIAVPGELMGYFHAHKKFASMTWKELVEPTIKLCHEGITLTQHMRDSLDKFNIKKNQILMKMFYNNETSDFYKVGSTITVYEPLCETYKILAENGPLDFYNGTLSKLVLADLEEIGSPIRHGDLITYQADTSSSITVELGDDILHVVPPVGSGVIVGKILNILKGYNFTHKSIANETQTGLTLHRLIEAFKFGYAKRWELGDMRYNDVRQLLSDCTNNELAADIMRKINDSQTSDDPHFYEALFDSTRENGTSHLSFLAPNGDAVSVTSSVNTYFGAGYVGNRTGIIFNSGMDDFSRPGESNFFGLPPSPSNYIAPQKRAQSSMAPTIVTDKDGNVKVVIGAAGGSKIISVVAQILMRILWLGEDIKQAIDAPRLYHQLVPNVLEYEYGVLEDVVKELEQKGHKTSRVGIQTIVCGISKNATGVYAFSDHRKKGGVAGF
ncbi:hypothetical protein ACFFRR_002197 [Megaselia abdita]